MPAPVTEPVVPPVEAVPPRDPPLEVPAALKLAPLEAAPDVAGAGPELCRQPQNPSSTPAMPARPSTALPRVLPGDEPPQFGHRLVGSAKPLAIVHQAALDDLEGLGPIVDLRNGDLG